MHLVCCQIGESVNQVGLPQVVFLCAERVTDERQSREDTSFFRLTRFPRKRTLRKSINRRCVILTEGMVLQNLEEIIASKNGTHYFEGLVIINIKLILQVGKFRLQSNRSGRQVMTMESSLSHDQCGQKTSQYSSSFRLTGSVIKKGFRRYLTKPRSKLFCQQSYLNIVCCRR